LTELLSFTMSIAVIIGLMLHREWVHQLTLERQVFINVVARFALLMMHVANWKPLDNDRGSFIDSGQVKGLGNRLQGCLMIVFSVLQNSSELRENTCQ